MAVTDDAPLPVVDIGPYLDPAASPSQRTATATAVHAACRDFGFFYLVGHGVPESLRQEMLRLGHEFFARPQGEKDRLSLFHSLDKIRGYSRLGENITYGKRDIVEGFDFYREYPSPSATRLLGSQLWPSRPAALRPTLLAYVARLIPVGQALGRAMGDGLGVPDGAHAFDEVLADPFWGLKLANYPPLSTTAIDDREKGISCGEHTDYGGLTFLLCDDHIMSALEVQGRNGEWIKADPIPGTYVVNIGDMISVLTNNRYTATVHRVIHRGSETRLSIPFFLEPNLSTLVKPIAACADPSDTTQRSATSFYEHMCSMLYDGRFVESGKKVDKIIVNQISLKG